MSCVISDIELLESPFPRSSQREQMCFGCWPLRHSSFKFYKVFMGLKVILGNKNIIGSIGNGFNGIFKMNLVIKLRELMLLY